MANIKPTHVSTAGLPKPVNPNSDTVSANGFYVQNDTSNDTNVGVSRGLWHAMELWAGGNPRLFINPNGSVTIDAPSDDTFTLFLMDAGGTSAALYTDGRIQANSFTGSGAGLTNIPNSATTATSDNTASAIVARDASGNFTAATITATLSGNASTATAATTATKLSSSRTFALTGDITGSASSDLTTGVSISTTHGALAGGNLHAVATMFNSGFMSSSDKLKLDGATSLNTANKLVSRDASGNFAAGTITAALTGNASTATALSSARTFELTGDITGSVSSDLTSGASIATTHGSLGGGALHSAATTSTAGFMSASDKTKLDDAASTNTASRLVIRDASGNFAAGTITAALTGNASTATALSSARSFALTGDITGSVSSDLTSGASIATTHGSLGGGSMHSVATTSTAGFMSASDKTKLDGLSGGVSGSGIANQVAFWSSGSGLSSDSAFYWDNSNKRLGINATPTASLQINTLGSTGRGILVRTSDNTGPSPFVEIQGRGSTLVQGVSGGLALAGHSTEGMVAPNKHLGTIYFGGNHTSMMDYNLAYAASISAISEGWFNDVNTMPTALVFYTGKAGLALGNVSTTFGTERLRITSGGSVKISAPTTGYALEAAGGGKFTGDLEVSGNLTVTGRGIFGSVGTLTFIDGTSLSTSPFSYKVSSTSADWTANFYNADYVYALGSAKVISGVGVFRVDGFISYTMPGKSFVALDGPAVLRCDYLVTLQNSANDALTTTPNMIWCSSYKPAGTVVGTANQLQHAKIEGTIVGNATTWGTVYIVVKSDVTGVFRMHPGSYLSVIKIA